MPSAENMINSRLLNERMMARRERGEERETEKGNLSPGTLLVSDRVII